MEKTLNKIRNVINYLVIILFIYMVLAVFYQVLGRYVFSYKLGAAAETATMAQIWMILLASGIAMKKNMHVGVDILLRKLNVKAQKIVVTASTIIIMTFLIMVLKGSVQLIIVGAQSTSPAISIPMWIPYLSVPIGILYIMLELIILTFNKLKQK
jgi:TRAP-type C4-dicarboxylate transport system permease small subunit|tara:strand:- start:897 stop:1361 length:465 start_codon:yes stop_codon:yes gene_type:complete